jgi:acyl dehydratase
MTAQVYFEDVAVGMQLCPLTKGPLTIKDLVKFAAATNDYSEIHYDESVVRERNLPAPVIHGPLKSAFLAQLLTGWAGAEGVLKKLTCHYRGMDVAGEILTCHAKVVATSIQAEEHLVECEVWTENSKGEATTRGTAVVALPSRAARRDPKEISLITGEMRRDLRLGMVAGRFEYEVDRKWIDRFAAAFEDPNPLWHDEEFARREGRFNALIAPPTFFAALDPVETKELLLDPWVETLPYKNTGGGNAFNEVEYYLPIRAGDRIGVEVTYTDIYERDGRSGRLLIRVRENVLRNQEGVLVARARSGHIRSYDLTQPREA